jgi:mannose-1-phosphate guanylyltransferase
VVVGLAPQPRDANGNSLRGRAVVIDSTNVLVRSEEQVVAVIGLKDLVVVATGGRRAGR